MITESLILIWILSIIINYYLFGFSYPMLLQDSRKSDIHFITFWEKIIHNNKRKYLYKIIISIMWVIIVSMPKYIIDFALKQPITTQLSSKLPFIIGLYSLLVILFYFTVAAAIFKKNIKSYDIIKTIK